MGAIPLKTVTSRFPLAGENQTSEAPGVVFDPTIGEQGVETPLPNDSSKASLSPPVGGRLRSFRRDWQTNKCSSNVLNIMTNGYVLPFLSKPNLVRFPLILSEYKTLPKDQALADCIQSLPSKNAIERVENLKSLGFYSRLFLVPKPHQRWRPVIDLSRLNTFLHVEKFKMETPESIRTSLVPGEWVSSIDLSDAYLHIPIQPNSSQVFQFTSLHFELATAPPPPGLYDDRKGSEAHGPLQRTQTSPIPGRLADQVPVSGRSPSEHSGSGRPNPVLGVDNKSGKIRTDSCSGDFVHGLRIPSRFSPCKTHSREMAQTSGFDPTTQVKTCFDCKMFDVANWVACLNGEDGPGGTPSHEALLVSSQGALEISSVTGQSPSLDRCHFCTPRLVAESCKRDERCRPSSQRPQYPTLYRRLKRRLGRSLRSKIYPGSVVRPGKRATHKHPRVEGGLTGPSKFQGTVPGPNSSSCNGQLDSGSLHKQTRGNSLSRDVRSPVEDHDLVPPLSRTIKGQTHSGLSECDGRPIQVQPSAVNRMVTASTGVQTDLPEVVHSSCGPVCHSSEPQTPSLCVSHPRPKGLGHRCSEHKLDGSHCLCLPSDGSPSQGDPKDQAMPLLIIIIAPGWPGMPWFWDLVQLSTEIPLQLPVSTALLKQSHKYVFHNNPPRLVSRIGQLQEQGFSVEVAERIAAPQGSSTRTIYKSKWALFEKWCKENLVDFSTRSVKPISDFFMYLYQDLNRRPSTIDGYRTAIVDTLGPTAHHIAHNADLHRLLSSFHRDRPKSSRNLPKWNLSVVLNELTKAPFEPMKDTDLNILPSKLLSFFGLRQAPQQNPCLGRKQSI